MNKMTVYMAALMAIPLLSACGEQSAQPQQMPPASVTAVTLDTERVTLTRELPGRTNPFLVAEVRPQVSGVIKEQLFTEGGEVEAGQPLYQLDDAAYRAEFNSAKAQLARAEAALHSAQLTAERTAELVSTGAVSTQQNDNAVAALRQAEADVAVADAAVASARVVLGYARIVSPIDGRIGRSTVTRGALVTANQPDPLATVQQLDPIYVDLNQSATELLELRRQLQAGTLKRADDVPVTLLLEDGTRYPHPGKLKFAEVTVDPSTGSSLLRVVVPNPEYTLMPGMYVRAVVTSGVRENAILVPQQGITRDPKGNTTAMIVNEEGMVEARQVKVNRTIGDKWLVDEGLAAGDRVIVEGLQKIQPGKPVQITDGGQGAENTEGDDADPAVESQQ